MRYPVRNLVQFLHIHEHLNAHKGQNPFTLVAEHGQAFAPAELPDGICWGEKKQCFKNASTLALAHPRRYVYCEGFAVPNIIGIPIHHGWIYDLQTGQIIDNTWREGASAYLGVPFSADFLAGVCLTNQVYGSLIFDEKFVRAKSFEDIIFNLNHESQIKS